AAQSHFVEKLLCNEADTGSVLRILVNVYNLPLAVEAWQVVIIAPALAARSDDLRAKLREVLPDGVTPLLRDCRSDGRLALILAYEKGRYDGKSAITDLLSICAGIGRFGLSQRFEDVEELPLAYAQAAIALNDGGDKFLFTPTDAPQSAEIVALEKAIEKSDPEKLLECLNAYLLTLQEDTSNAAAHKLHAMHALLLCQRRLSAMGKNRSSIRLDAVLDGLHMPLRAWASLWSAEIVAFVRQLTQDREDALPTSQIACMCAYLQNQCLDTDFTVQKMAEHFDITLPALNAFFKSATGMTVAQYFSNLKMELAKTLLKTTDISIYEIGLKLGYYGPSSFIRRFKQVTEMTPGEYRDTCALHEVD
ncbi:MAG: helix-turn-helix domain-containing protein, partial [Clostridia bacterium]